MRSVRCNGCRNWFTAKTERCPYCGLLRPAHNVGLVAARCSSALWDSAHRAVAEDTF